MSPPDAISQNPSLNCKSVQVDSPSTPVDSAALDALRLAEIAYVIAAERLRYVAEHGTLEQLGAAVNRKALAGDELFRARLLAAAATLEVARG